MGAISLTTIFRGSTCDPEKQIGLVMEIEVDLRISSREQEDVEPFH